MTASAPVSASPAAAVTWERLLLEGFGRHRRLEVAFAEGLGTWTGPNETGKSTAVMGLLATVWGLPHLQDPEALGWTRFRSWSGGPHRGWVTLRGRDGARYTVSREFDRHQVRVVAHRAGGDEVVVEAVHNPNARRETSPYEPWLAAVVGVTDLALVLETFVVAQGDGGQEPHRLQHDVQALVSGAGGGSYRAALERLAERLRSRTKNLRTLDLGLADARNDRELEARSAEIDALRRALEAGRAGADGMQAAQVALARAEDGARTAAEAGERLRATARAQTSWVDRRDGARREARRLTEAQRALTRAQALAAAATEAEAALDQTWPAFEGAPDGVEAQLETLALARRGIAEAQGREAEARRDLDARREEADAALAQLVREAAVAAAAAAARREEGDPLRERSWDALGVPSGPTVARMRRSATVLVRQVDTVRAARERLRESLAEFDPVDVFGEADDATRELLASYVPRGRALAESLVRARTRFEELKERCARHEAAFAAVRAWGDEEVAALRAFESAWEARRSPWPGRFVAGVAGAAAGWFGVPLAVELLGGAAPAWGSWLGAAVIGLAAAALVPSGDGTAGARARLEALGIEGDDETLRLRLRQREAFEAQRDQVEDDETAYRAAEAEAAAAEAEGVAFRDAVVPFRAVLPEGIEPGEAYARWTLLAPRVARDREALQAQAGYLTEAAVEALDDAPAASAGELGVELARLAAFHGVVDAPLDAAPHAVTVLDLAAWLERVSDATWEHWQEDADHTDGQREARAREARARDEARERWASRIVDAEAALERCRETLAEAQGEEAAALATLSWLWPRLAVAAADAGPDAASAMGPRAAQGTPAAAAVGLIGDDEVPDIAVRGLDGPASEVAAPVDVQLLRQGYAERRRAEEELSSRRRELRAHLAACGVATVEDLERSLEHATVAAGAALTAWGDLVRLHPDLPSADLGVDDDVEARFRRTEESARAATAAERAAHEAVLEAQRSLARSQGATVVNIAATELALQEAEADVARLRGEIDTLAVAHRELGAAVEDFRQEHRQRLETRAGAYLATFSGIDGRRVELGDGFAATVREPGGDVAVPAQLSQGARDQLALALRLAVADLVSDDVALPLVFDDPFLHWDETRLARAREALERLARERQVLVLSHRAAIDAWGSPVTRSA